MIVKVCGMRAKENIQALAQAGADWMGLIFFPGSKRYVGEQPELAAWLASAEGQNLGMRRVGVFVDAPATHIQALVGQYSLNCVQLHGQENAAQCLSLREQLGPDVCIIKTFAIRQADDFNGVKDYSRHCDYFLFDTKTDQLGGSGLQFDWSLLDHYRENTPFLLSGGIGPEDAGAILAIDHAQMAGIDINSRFEFEPGQKNIAEIEQFIRALAA